MIRFEVVVREPGKLEPDYSLEFEAPSLPREGDYLSIQRPDHPEPFGEDMIVRKVWWRLFHGETGATTTDPKLGKLTEIFVECEPATGPYSSDNWRKWVSARGGPELEVDRFSVSESSVSPNGGD